MKWPAPVIEATLIKRYKRFLADFRLADGTVVTGHCANTGSMKTCMEDGAPCWITHHDDPKRKLKYSWQATQMPDGMVGIHTGLANHLVEEAILSGRAPELTGYASLAREKKYGTNSRIDILLEDPKRPACYVEVKNVTLLLREGVAGFPDAVTKRGTKHLAELKEIIAQGQRAVLFYCVQREAVQAVEPAEAYDPEYAAALRDTVSAGLEVMAMRAQFSPEAIQLTDRLPVNI